MSLFPCHPTTETKLLGDQEGPGSPSQASEEKNTFTSEFEENRLSSYNFLNMVAHKNLLLQLFIFPFVWCNHPFLSVENNSSF